MNAQDLLDDAELLSAAGRRARAYSLALLAVEEFGKASSLVALALMPESLRGQAPVRRLLDWHHMKQVGGLLIAAVPLTGPGAAASLAAMPLTDLAQILDTTNACAQETDELKLRGLYVDMQRGARVRRPSETTDAEVSGQLGRARQVVLSASPLSDPELQARLADPPAEAIELSRALVSAFAEAGDVRGPSAAAVVLKAVRKLQEQMAADSMPGRPC